MCVCFFCFDKAYQSYSYSVLLHYATKNRTKGEKVFVWNKWYIDLYMPYKLCTISFVMEHTYRISERNPPFILLFGFSFVCVCLECRTSAWNSLIILYQIHICTSLAHNCDMSLYLQRLSVHSCNRWYSNKLRVFKAFVNDVTNTWICYGFSCVCAENKYAILFVIQIIRYDNVCYVSACIGCFVFAKQNFFIAAL